MNLDYPVHRPVVRPLPDLVCFSAMMTRLLTPKICPTASVATVPGARSLKDMIRDLSAKKTET